RLMDYGLECNGDAQLVSHWSFGCYCNLVRSTWVAGALRGGPSLRVDPRASRGAYLTTDTRAPVWLSFEASGGRTPASDSGGGGGALRATSQARSNVDLPVGPAYSYRNEAMQYVDAAADEAGRPHHVFARLNQTSAAMTVRLNGTFSPRLS